MAKDISGLKWIISTTFLISVAATRGACVVKLRFMRWGLAATTQRGKIPKRVFTKNVINRGGRLTTRTVASKKGQIASGEWEG